MLKDAGADVDAGSRARALRPRRSSKRKIGLAPSEFTLHARNPARNLVDRRRRTSPSARSPARPTSSDRDGGRRPGNRRDYQNLIRLGQTLDAVHLLGRLSGRAGRHPRLGAPSRRAVRHADPVRQADPRLFARPRAQSRRHRDDPHRARHRRRDAGARALAVHHHQLVLAAAGSTRRCWRASSRWRARNQVVVLTPFTLAGAMAPVTLAGALAQQNAEALAGLVMTQIGAARLAFRLWRLHLQRRHEVGRAGLRHAGIHEGGARRRPAGAALRPALPLVQHQRRQHARCAGGL